jgi:hypothetical protein
MYAAKVRRIGVDSMAITVLSDVTRKYDLLLIRSKK